MLILGIETSCDETAAAIVERQSPARLVKIWSSGVASSEEMHIKTGGIVPEVASREQTKVVIPIIKQAIEDSGFKIQEIDAIAVTTGPGLIGSLLVGVETVRALAYAWGKPTISVNHLGAHLYANFVGKKENGERIAENLPEFPAVGLVASGGHTDLVFMRDHGRVEWLGGTRDDAAGECFDKCGRVLGLPYPGGPAIAAEAAKYSARKIKSTIHLPRPLLHSNDYDFSFSGLKTAVLREALRFPRIQEVQGVQKVSSKVQAPQDKQEAEEELAWEIQEAIVEVLVAKVVRAIDKLKPKAVLLGGGVAANIRLREMLELKIKNLKLKINLHIPPPELCTDNAVSIATWAVFNQEYSEWDKLKTRPDLRIV